MVKWEALNRPKDFGGLGFTDVRVMNTCLVAKWFARLEANDLSICCELLRKKYLCNKSIFQIKRISESLFWRGLLSTRQWFQWGRVIKVKSGQQTRFWLDVWLGECPLKITFHQLYSFYRDQEMCVSQACRNGEWYIPFRRLLTPAELEEWRNC